MLKKELIKSRGWCCENCGQPQVTLEAHHCLIHRMKGHPELDCEENIMLVCHNCHESGEVNSWECRKRFWEKQTTRYDMKKWLDNLNLKVKPRFD